MSAERTIGGEPWTPKVCGDCREYNLSWCNLWHQHMSARSGGCGYFMPKDTRTDAQRRKASGVPEPK